MNNTPEPTAAEVAAIAARPAPQWLWSQRADTMTALFGAVADDHPLAEAVTMQFYRTIALASGEDADQAEAVAWRQTRQWFRSNNSSKGTRVVG